MHIDKIMEVSRRYDNLVNNILDPSQYITPRLKRLIIEDFITHLTSKFIISTPADIEETKRFTSNSLNQYIIRQIMTNVPSNNDTYVRTR